MGRDPILHPSSEANSSIVLCFYVSRFLPSYRFCGLLLVGLRVFCVFVLFSMSVVLFWLFASCILWGALFWLLSLINTYFSTYQQKKKKKDCMSISMLGAFHKMLVEVNSQ